MEAAPTYFGDVTYRISSEADLGSISATIAITERKTPGSIILRFRHPKASPIRSVTVNGEAWSDFDPDKETITVKALKGTVRVTAFY